MYSVWSVFNSKSKKYRIKYRITSIHLYSIGFHPYIQPCRVDAIGLQSGCRHHTNCIGVYDQFECIRPVVQPNSASMRMICCICSSTGNQTRLICTTRYMYILVVTHNLHNGGLNWITSYIDNQTRYIYILITSKIIKSGNKNSKWRWEVGIRIMELEQKAKKI